MEKNFKRTTVTSALPYANGPVHIGHLAGVYVPADIYVRYLRLKKEDVLFIGGSDEHGVPITIRAKKEGVTPQDIVDRYHTLIKDSFKEFGISFDVYGRTSSPTHHQLASDFFRKLYDKHEFIEKTSMQYYDEEAHTFLADRYITGECPRCHAEGAYGDQCEKCGSTLSPTELINWANILTLKDAFEAGIDFSSVPVYLVGVVVAAVSGYASIRLLRYVADKGRFGAFAYYCWAAGVLTLVLMILH